jgi:hypothetical protein
MKTSNAPSIVSRIREAANQATREMRSHFVARFASRVASMAGDELVERIAALNTREQLEALRGVLTRDQFLLVVELYDVLQAYALRASATASSTRHHVSSIT